MVLARYKGASTRTCRYRLWSLTRLRIRWDAPLSVLSSLKTRCLLSRSFMTKPWPQHELRGLVTREIDGHSAIVPIWHEVTRAEVSDFSPTLADKLAVRTSDASATDIALQLLAVIRPDLYAEHPRAELEALANGEAIGELQREIEQLRTQLADYQCPTCGAGMVGQEHIDYDERSSGVVETFECGHSRGGWVERPCPFDPKFPKLEEYDLQITRQEDDTHSYVCSPMPTTDMARRVNLPTGIGRTAREALEYVVEHYNYLITPPRQEFRGKWIQRSGYPKPDSAG